jgi:hypothetical protein
MLLLPTVSLLLPFTAAVPLESQPSVKHPSIDTLNTFSTQVKAIADSVTSWDGQFGTGEGLLRRCKDAISTLHMAVVQMEEADGIDYWSSSLGFIGAGLSVGSNAHTFTNSIESKRVQFKGLHLESQVFLMLDSAFTEATAFFTATKKKMPEFVYSLLKPFHSELLGTLATTRELFRPKQEVVVIIMDGPGGPTSYTMPAGASIATIPAEMPTRSYQPPPQATAPAQYPQQPPRYSSQYAPQPPHAHYTAYTPVFGPSNQPQYAAYTPLSAQSRRPQYTTFTPQINQGRLTQFTPAPLPSTYAWFPT